MAWESFVNFQRRHRNFFFHWHGLVKESDLWCVLLVVSVALGRMLQKKTNPFFSFDSLRSGESFVFWRWDVRGMPWKWQIRLPHALPSLSQWLAQNLYITMCSFIHQGDFRLQRQTAWVLGDSWAFLHFVLTPPQKRGRASACRGSIGNPGKDKLKKLFVFFPFG